MFNAKRKYFSKKLVGVRAMLWDREFKVFKLRELREDIRKEYDRNREIADSLKKQTERDDLKKDVKATLTEKMAGTNADVAKIEAQLKQLDEEQKGVEAEIDGLHELRKMLTDYIATRT